MFNKGLTIVELLIVLFIISVIAFYITYFIYKTDKVKAYISVDVIPYLRTCISDIAVFCINHPGRSFNRSLFSNCQNRLSLYGNVTLEVPNGTCTLKGTLPLGYQIKAFSSVSDKFYSVCKYTEGGIVCYINPAD